MRGWKRAGVGLAVGMMVLTGCGGGEKPTTASTSTAPSAQGGARSGAWAKLQADYQTFLRRECDSTTGSTKAGVQYFVMCINLTKTDLPSFRNAVVALPASKSRNDLLAQVDRLSSKIDDYVTNNCSLRPEELECGTKAVPVSTTQSLVKTIVNREVQAGN